MKVALVTDLHFGARSDNVFFDKFFEEFYKNIFFPRLEEEGISYVFILGDVFDRRKYINFNILKQCKRYFFDELEKRKLNVQIIVGNHDVYFKNTNSVNSLDLLLTEYDNIVVHSEPAEIALGEARVLVMPWINSENYSDSMKMLETSLSPVCFGHFEIAGFQMYKGQPNEHGLSKSVFDKFDLVCSGHFHHRSNVNQVHYLGNPYEITWADHDDPRGFHIFDTKTLALQFIENPYKMFIKVYYDDTKKEAYDFNALASKHVKIIVVNKTDFYSFDRFLENVYKAAPLEVKILEDFEEFEDAAVDDSVDIEDTMSLLGHYVDSVETDMNKEKIKTTLKELYVEALQADKEG